VERQAATAEGVTPLNGGVRLLHKLWQREPRTAKRVRHTFLVSEKAWLQRADGLSLKSVLSGVSESSECPAPADVAERRSLNTDDLRYGYFIRDESNQTVFQHS